MHRSVLAVTVACVLLLAVLVGYFIGKQTPSLVAPISIESASALANGGSVHIVLRDAEGRRYAIGVEDSLRPQSEFEVYVQPWFSVLPVPVPIAQVASVLRSRGG